MDGLNLRLSSDTIDTSFHFDKFGSLIPSDQCLQMDKVANMVDRQNKADTGYYRRVSEMTYRVDVERTNNPYGNTYTLGAGRKLFGPRPMDKHSFDERITGDVHGRLLNEIQRREEKIEQSALRQINLYKSLEPDANDFRNRAIWLQEGYQVLTGGGFDGSKIGDTTNSGLNFVIRGSEKFDYEDTTLSQIIVDGSKWLREWLEQWGLIPGSIKPMGATQVRLAQETDGMLGWPVYSKALNRLTKDIAVRLLLVSGVDTRMFVDTTVIDARDGKRVMYRVVDALAYILDKSTFRASDLPSIITLLVRTQKHGWKYNDDKLEPKPSKTRSIYPNSALPGIIEAMVFAPFNSKLKELKVPFMPSLQDKPTQIDLIEKILESAKSEGYDFLGADWSKYDATVKGCILATMIYYAVRPFYNSVYYPWVDFAIYALTYKYLMLNDDLCKINNDSYSAALQCSKNVQVGKIVLFGMTNGLISGAKFTHVGGSMYGEVVVHYGIPRLLHYDPIPGPQGGDDTLMAYPKNRIDTSSCEKTFTPVSDSAKQFGLDLNVSKQDWWVVLDEVGKVFLQNVYHLSSGVMGVGSIFRPYAAVWFSETNKNLSIAEQLIAEITRMNNGYDNPFAREVVHDWLTNEEVIGTLFKEYGQSAFQEIVKCIGVTMEELAQRIDVGSFSFGVTRDDLQQGRLGILPIIADVSANMEFSITPSEAFRLIGEKDEESTEKEDSPDAITYSSSMSTYWAYDD